MSYSELVKPSIHKQPVYEPGKPIEVVAREFGLEPGQIAKLASNENPLGTSPMAAEAIRNAAGNVWLYPENASFYLCNRLAELCNVTPDMLTIGAGSSDIHYMLGDLFLQPGVELLMGEGAFITMFLVALLYGATPVRVPLVNYTHDLDAMLAAITPRTRIVYLPNPNNPTGTLVGREKLDAFIRALPEHVVLVYDEAYSEYVDDPFDILPYLREGFKVITTRTFSKIYGLAGLRIGYSVSSVELAGLLSRVRPPFNVSVPAQVGALAALDDTDFVQRSKAVNAAGLKQLEAGFARLGMQTIPSSGNFVMVHFGPDAAGWFQRLQARGVIVRPVTGYGFPEFLRVSIGLPEQNALLLTLVEELRAHG